MKTTQSHPVSLPRQKHRSAAEIFSRIEPRRVFEIYATCGYYRLVSYPGPPLMGGSGERLVGYIKADVSSSN